jgi:hypothetical protein
MRGPAVCQVLVNGVVVGRLRVVGPTIVGVTWSRRDPAEPDPRWLPRFLVPAAAWGLELWDWLRNLPTRRPGRRVGPRAYLRGASRIVLAGGTLENIKFGAHVGPGDEVVIRFTTER